MINFIQVATDTTGATIYGRVDDDGLIRYTCIAEDAEYQAWLKNQETFN